MSGYIYEAFRPKDNGVREDQVELRRQSSWSTLFSTVPTVDESISDLSGTLPEAPSPVSTLGPTSTIGKRPRACSPMEMRGESKQAIFNDKRRACAGLIIHLIPAAITLGVVLLNALQVYWQDASWDTRTQNLELGALQVVAKTHEVLIVASLSAIVLHHWRHQLLSSKGMPFGLFTSGFQVANGGCLAQRDFWNGTCWRRWPSRRNACLTALLLLAALLALTVGPASAVAVIPKLGWWHRGELSVATVVSQLVAGRLDPSAKFYLPYRRDKIWPTTLDNSSLSSSYCLDPDMTSDFRCPAGGFDAIREGLLTNATEDTSKWSMDVFQRPMNMSVWQYKNGSTDFEGVSFALASTPSQKLFDDLTLNAKYESISAGGGHPAHKLKLLVDGSPKAPGVAARALCEKQSAGAGSVKLPPVPFNAFWETGSKTQLPCKGDETVDLKTIWSAGELSNPETISFRWADWTDRAKRPMLGALLLLPRNMSDSARTADGPPDVLVCTVDAAWTGLDMSSVSGPDETPTIHADPHQHPGQSGELANGGGGASSSPRLACSDDDDNSGDKDAAPPSKNTPGARIAITSAWAAALAVPLPAASSSSNTTTNTTTTTIERLLTHLSTTLFPAPSSAWIPAPLLSRALAALLADAIARTSADAATLVSTAPCTSPTCAQVSWRNTPLLPTWPDRRGLAFPADNGFAAAATPEHLVDVGEAEAQGWVRVAYAVEAYGYGYGYGLRSGGAGARAAVVPLLAHLLLVVVHCAWVVAGSKGETYALLASVGEAVVLAARSRGAVGREGVWARRVGVRVVGEEEVDEDGFVAVEEGRASGRGGGRLEFVFDEEEGKTSGVGIGHGYGRAKAKERYLF